MQPGCRHCMFKWKFPGKLHVTMYSKSGLHCMQKEVKKKKKKKEKKK